MSKYNILSKDKSGNEYGKCYTIEYQIKEYGSKHFKVDLYCLNAEKDNIRYVFIDGSNHFGIDTETDREEFLQEFYKFQKGGSYRKLHPINKSKIDVLKEKVNNTKKELKDLEKELNDEVNKEIQYKLKTYYDDVDTESLDRYITRIKEAFKDDRYYVSEISGHIWLGYRILIYDNHLNKPVKAITISNYKVGIENISEYDIK